MSESNKPSASPGLFVFELAIFVSIFLADWADYIPLSKTPELFLAAWVFMRIRGVTWRMAGFHLPKRLLRVVVIGLVSGAAMFGFEFFVLQKALYAWTGQYPDLHEFEDLVGNLPLLAVYLCLNLLLAGLGEELVWRGYALPRVASLFGGTAKAWLAALFLVNVAFGLAHVYQGWPGVVETTSAGLFLGVLYLITGKNLLAPIIAHVTSNAIDLTIIYLGLYPGVGQ